MNGRQSPGWMLTIRRDDELKVIRGECTWLVLWCSMYVLEFVLNTGGKVQAPIKGNQLILSPYFQSKTLFDRGNIPETLF